MTIKNDQNFDNLSSRFRKNIYNTAKGQIRLKILWRDISEQIPAVESGGLSVLDVGAGQGNFALELAKKRNQLTLCDLSRDMLEDAKVLFADNKLEDNTQFIHCSAQELSNYIDEQYDLVLFHAVMEWLVEPEETLKKLLPFVKKGGYLSVMFYSKTGLIYQNLTRGNFDYVLNDSLSGEGKSLTPTNPQKPDDVYKWIDKLGLTVIAKSGVRVFYDGISRDRRKQISDDDLFELEKRFSRIEPYCSLSRYIHVLCENST